MIETGRICGAPLEIGRFLHLAVAIAAALGKLHTSAAVSVAEPAAEHAHDGLRMVYR